MSFMIFLQCMMISFLLGFCEMFIMRFILASFRIGNAQKFLVDEHRISIVFRKISLWSLLSDWILLQK